MHPKPCPHCGVMFMARPVKNDAVAICNSCELRERKHTPKEVDMSIVQVIVYCPKTEFERLQEITMNKGISPSEYFMNLHDINMRVQDFGNDEVDVEEPKDETETQKKQKVSKKK
jgi:hypothetical protein